MIQQKPKIQKYVPLVISGCSGVGKGTLIANLLQYFPELFELSVSYTTRKPRPNEQHGREYFFVSRAEFQKLIKENGFLEYCQVHGQYYGTNAAQVQQIMAKGKICLLDIDIQGAEKVHAQHGSWNFIFIGAPSLEKLEGRIRGRGVNTQEEIKKRLMTAEREMKRLGEIDFYKVIVNDKMEECYGNFIHHINAKYHLLIEIEK